MHRVPERPKGTDHLPHVGAVTRGAVKRQIGMGRIIQYSHSAYSVKYERHSYQSPRSEAPSRLEHTLPGSTDRPVQRPERVIIKMLGQLSVKARQGINS